MIVKFRKKFSDDLNDISDKVLLKSISNIIQNVESSNKPQEIVGIKKMSGHKDAFRIRIGNYRIGVFIYKDCAEYTRILSREKFIDIFLNQFSKMNYPAWHGFQNFVKASARICFNQIKPIHSN